MNETQEQLLDQQGYTSAVKQFVREFVIACLPLDHDEFCACMDDAENEYYNQGA